MLLSYTVPDPCLSDPCDVNADCTRQSLLNSLFNCTCRLPFEGSGMTCFSELLTCYINMGIYLKILGLGRMYLGTLGKVSVCYPDNVCIRHVHKSMPGRFRICYCILAIV